MSDVHNPSSRLQEEIHQESLALSRQRKDEIVPYMEEEVLRFEEEVAAFRAGKVDEKIFMPFRLRQGVYGQRQADHQMFRVKIPGGILTPEALTALGVVADRFAPLKKGHITTRENVQFHHLRLEDCAEVMRLLGAVGLTTREACGNTVRNVVGAPTAGVCPDELFDVTPYLAAYVRFGVRHPITQDFPRKFKTSFTGSVAHDAVASAIHDFSFIAQVKDDHGVQRRGFRVLVGGGTSIMPRLGKVLYDFVPVEDYLRVALAVWTVFNRADMLRKNRMMARIKVLIDRIGIDTFKAQVDEELQEVGPIDPVPLMDIDELHRETPPQPPTTPVANRAVSPEYLHWIRTNTLEQKQRGYDVVYVTVPLGDIYAHQWRGLAEIVRRYTGGRARTTQEQNLALRWVPEAYLPDVWQALKEIGFAEPDAHTITDVVACPGTDSCKLGITSSMGLGRAIRDALASWDGLLEDALVKKLHIKMSGCPNGCSQHHVANIGLQGAATKGPGGQQIPAYDVFLGGAYGGERIDATRFGQRLGVKVPAKRVPEFIRDTVGFYKEHRREQEEFNAFVDRVGLKLFEEIAARYKEAPPLSADTLNLYMDWGKGGVYKVERGEGECAV
jgi:sulfite reductase beta subunit-like hemoprotein